MGYSLLGVESLGCLKETHLTDLEALEAVPGERDLAKPRLAFIRRLVVDELFDRCEWAACHCKENDKDYRVNGQHSSKVLREVLDGQLEGGVWPKDARVVMTRYECDGVVDLSDVFDQFDSHRSTRKADDKLGIFMAQHKDLIGIDKQTCGRILAGVSWGANHVPGIKDVCDGHIPGDAYSRGSLLNIEEVRDFVDLMHGHVGAPFKEWQQKSGIIARMFDMFLADRETAELAIEQTMYEAGEKTEEFTKKIRRCCSRTGHDQGYFFRQTDKFVRSQLKDIASLGRDAIKGMIREVLAEGGEEDSEE